MNKILNIIGVNDKTRQLTKPVKKEKAFTRVKDVVPPIEDMNYMADLLMLPTTKKGFRYVLAVVDLASDEFDIEPLKTKSSKNVLKGIKNIFKRKWLNKPKASLQTDQGTEFKDEFNKYLYNENILHKVTLVGRHKQNSNIEALNRQLGKLFNSYMNMREIETGKQYNEWDDIMNIVRIELNKIRLKKTYSEKEYIKNIVPNIPIFESKTDPKFEIGDIVYRKLDQPKNALGHNLRTDTFREGDFRWDIIPRKIKKVLYYNGKVKYRYLLNGFPNVSFTEAELMKADDDNEKFEIKSIIDKKKIKGRIYYKVWWKGFKKSESTWEPRTILIKDAKSLIDQFESIRLSSF